MRGCRKKMGCDMIFEYYISSIDDFTRKRMPGMSHSA